MLLLWEACDLKKPHVHSKGSDRTVLMGDLSLPWLHLYIAGFPGCSSCDIFDEGYSGFTRLVVGPGVSFAHLFGYSASFLILS